MLVERGCCRTSVVRNAPSTKLEHINLSKTFTVCMLSAHAHAAGVFRYLVEKRRHPWAVLDPCPLSTSTFLSPLPPKNRRHYLHPPYDYCRIQTDGTVERSGSSCYVGCFTNVLQGIPKTTLHFLSVLLFFLKGMWCVCLCVCRRERERERAREDEQILLAG